MDDIKKLKNYIFTNTLSWIDWIKNNDYGYSIEDNNCNGIKIKLRNSYARNVFGFSVNDLGDSLITFLDVQELYFLQVMPWTKININKKEETLSIISEEFDISDNSISFEIILNINISIVELFEEEEEQEITFHSFFLEEENGKHVINEAFIKVPFYIIE